MLQRQLRRSAALCTVSIVRYCNRQDNTLFCSLSKILNLSRENVTRVPLELIIGRLVPNNWSTDHLMSLKSLLLMFFNKITRAPLFKLMVFDTTMPRSSSKCVDRFKITWLSAHLVQHFLIYIGNINVCSILCSRGRPGILNNATVSFDGLPSHSSLTARISPSSCYRFTWRYQNITVNVIL